MTERVGIPMEVVFDNSLLVGGKSGPHVAWRISYAAYASNNDAWLDAQDRGHVVARWTNGNLKSISFRPKAGARYRAPGSDQAPFRGTQYFLQVPPSASNDEYAIKITMKHGME